MVKNNKEYYIMYKPCGTGWSNINFLKVAIEEIDGKVRLYITDGNTTLQKMYGKVFGEVYDNFMWIASLDKIDKELMLKNKYEYK